jgi:ADP-heptose:LPS heptosyltransferase
LRPGSLLERAAKRLLGRLLARGASPPAAGRFHPGGVTRALALRPDRLGDFLLTIPALKSLEKGLGPRAKLVLAAGEANARVAGFFFPRAVVRVFPKSFPGRTAFWTGLGRRPFGLAVDFHSYPFSATSALTALFSRSPHRAGFWAVGEKEGLSRRAFNLGVRPPPENLHESEKAFRLVRRLGRGFSAARGGKTEVPPVPGRIRSRVRGFYAESGLSPRTFLLAVHPTLGKEDNRWSQDRYLELIRRVLSRRGDVRILVVHGRGEEGNLERFFHKAEGVPGLLRLPDNDVLFILEAAKRFDLFVCNDSGLMHLAALVASVLAVFGPSEPARWGPLANGDRFHRVFRAPDHLCDSVEPEVVAREVRRRIHLKRRSR